MKTKKELKKLSKKELINEIMKQNQREGKICNLLQKKNYLLRNQKVHLKKIMKKLEYLINHPYAMYSTSNRQLKK